MPRGPRIAIENSFYHVFNRGLNKCKIFLDEEDYNKFLLRLEQLVSQKNYDHKIFSYVLMPNHFHLFIQTKNTPLSKIMSSLNTSYSMFINKKYNRTGPLFQNRFKSILCDKESYFLSANRYILLNPIEAHLVKNIQDYPWSGYQEIFKDSGRKIVDRSAVMNYINATYNNLESYHKFVLEGIKNLESLKSEYSFEEDVRGPSGFFTSTQRKYLRRKYRPS